MDRRLVLVGAALLAVCAAMAYGQTPVRQKVAVKAGRIIPISGPEIENGVILIEEGRITAIGAGLETPWDANVIDASDKVVMPGYVEAHTSENLSTPNEQVRETPFVNAADGVDPVSWYIEDTLRGGVTTLLVLPGNDCVIGGTGVVIKPSGRTVAEMTVRPYVGMKISLQPRADTSRMAQIARLRDYFAALREYREQYNLRKADAEAAKKPFDEAIDPLKQSALDLIDGKLKAFVYCPLASDAVKALALGKELGFEIVPVLGSDCYKAAGALAEAGLPVIVDTDLTVWKTNEDTETIEMKVVPKILSDAGVRYALQRGPRDYESQYFWLQAARLVASGVSREEALRSVTLTPAEIIGLSDRVGSLEVGKDANLQILTGDPLDAQTWVDQVLIEGEVVYERSKDTRLTELLEKPKPEAEAPPAETPPAPEGGGAQ